MIIVRRMSRRSYKFLRLFLSLVKPSGSEEKFYQFGANCCTQISLRRTWIRNSARLLTYAFQYSFQSKHTLIKIKWLLCFFCPPLTHVCNARFLWRGFSRGPSAAALNSSWLYRTGPLAAEGWLSPTHACVTPFLGEPVLPEWWHEPRGQRLCTSGSHLRQASSCLLFSCASFGSHSHK